MTRVLKIGLTGGIASGKSQVSHLFAQHAIDIIDADEIARSLFKSGSPLLSKLRAKFGADIFDSKGDLIRKKLGAKVFQSEPDLQWLNQLTHPLVSEQIKKQIALSTSAFLVLDIPLLIPKSGRIPEHLQELVDRVLVVKVSPQTQIARLIKRDQISESQAKAIIDAQSSLEQKLSLADDVIENEGAIEQLESKVTLLHNKYMDLVSQAGSNSVKIER